MSVAANFPIQINFVKNACSGLSLWAVASICRFATAVAWQCRLILSLSRAKSFRIVRKHDLALVIVNAARVAAALQ